MVERFEVGARLSEASTHGGLVFLAGQVATDASQDAFGQTQQVLQSIDRLLSQTGSHKSRILMAQIFLADLSDFDAMNKAWDAWVVAGQPPCRATVQAKLAKPDWKVEIVVTAAR
jgi:enamine deaminase RidA (YjgF/YER057c/UK114 family)